MDRGCFLESYPTYQRLNLLSPKLIWTRVPFTDKTVRVFVGGVAAQVLSAVLQPSNVGLNQINAVIPTGVAPGNEVPIVIEVECEDGAKIRSREDVTIAVRPAP